MNIYSSNLLNFSPNSIIFVEINFSYLIIPTNKTFMQKINKTRTTCMNCLRSVVTDFQNGFDPIGTRLVVVYGCDQCGDESNDVQFYDSHMCELNQL